MPSWENVASLQTRVAGSRSRRRVSLPEVCARDATVTAVSATTHPFDRTATGVVGWLSVAAGLVAGIVLAVAPALPIVRATDGPNPGAVGPAAVIAAIVAIGIPLAAAVAHLRGRPALAGGLLVGWGTVATALVILDVHLARHPIDTNRFELFRPNSAARLTPGWGTWVVIAAHVLAVVAAVLGAITVSRAALDDGYEQTESDESAGRTVAARAGATASALVIVAAVAWAVSLFFPAWTSSDSTIVVPAVIAAGLLFLAATIALAVTGVAIATGALAAASPSVAAGAIVGGGAALFGLSGGRLAAGIADDALSPSAATVLGSIAAVLVVLAGCALPVLTRVRERAVAAAGVHPDRTDSALRPAGVARRHVVAGVAGIATALLTGIGALLPVLSVPDGLDAPQSYATRLVVVGAAVLLVVSVFLLLSEFASLVRPAVGPVLLVVVLADAGVLQAAADGMRIPGVEMGVGTIVLIVAVVCAVATGSLVWLAAAAERDDVDRSVEPVVDRVTAVAGVVAAALSVAALATPLFSGSEAAATSFMFPWGFDTWAQAALAVGIVVVAVVAPRGRPVRGASASVGAAVAMAVYAAGWPLTISRVPDAAIGPAVPLTGLAIVALLALAVVLGKSSKSAMSTSQ